MNVVEAVAFLVGILVGVGLTLFYMYTEDQE